MSKAVSNVIGRIGATSESKETTTVAPAQTASTPVQETATATATVEPASTVASSQAGGSRKRLQKGRRLTKRAKRS
jgi:hypothetical protein